MGLDSLAAICVYAAGVTVLYQLRRRSAHCSVRFAAAGERRGRAIAVQRSAGADNLERTTGEWRGGTWTDFDPHRSRNGSDGAAHTSRIAVV
jgi:hypothetical protein